MTGLDFEVSIVANDRLFLRLSRRSALTLAERLQEQDGLPAIVSNSTGRATIEISLTGESRVSMDYERTDHDLEGCVTETRTVYGVSTALDVTARARGFFSNLSVKLRAPTLMLESLHQHLQLTNGPVTVFEMQHCDGQPHCVMVVEDEFPLSSYEVSYLGEVIPAHCAEAGEVQSAIWKVEATVKALTDLETGYRLYGRPLLSTPADLTRALLDGAALCQSLQDRECKDSPLRGAILECESRFRSLAGMTGKNRMLFLPRKDISQAERNTVLAVMSSLTGAIEWAREITPIARLEPVDRETLRADALRELETALGELPEDYRNFLQREVAIDPGWLNQLFPLLGTSSVFARYRLLADLDISRDLMVPIGDDGLGNHVFLSLRDDRGSVHFWDHEGGEMKRLADSFSAFLPTLDGPEP